MPDVASAQSAVNDFVSAYNAVISSINTQFTLDPSTKMEGPLAGDSNLRRLQSQLLSDATYSIAGNKSHGTLASLGIKMNNDGTLTADSSKLGNVLQAHFSDFQNFFQAADGTGFAKKLGSDLMTLNDFTRGLLSLSLNQNQNIQTALNHSINDMEGRLTLRRQQLTKQYDQVNAMLEQYPLLMAQLQAQLGSRPTGK